MKYVALSQGKYALVDDRMFEQISKFKWSFQKKPNGTGYAFRRPTINGRRHLILMHRFVLGANPGLEVDHINGDTLDNRLSNLRQCTTQQNQYNRGPQKNNACGMKGVYLKRATGKWGASITLDHRRVHLGYFPDKNQAAEAYNRAAVRHHGSFVRINR